MRTTGEIIKNYREQNSLTVLQLADKLNISQVLLTYIENNKRKLSEQVFEQMVKVLPKNICDEISEYEDYKKTPDSIKKKLEIAIKNGIQATSNNNLIKVEQTTHVIPFYPNIKAAAGRGKLNFDYTKEELEVPEKYAKANYVACIVEGDSMEPEIHEKDILILDTNEPSNLNNRIFVVWKNGEIYLKEIIDAGDSVMLHSRNGIYKPMHVKKTEIKIIGRVVASYREY